MIETHCHLNFHSYKKDYARIAKDAFDVGVTKIINVGAKLDSSRRAVKIANEIPFCFAAVGVHPHHAEEMKDSSLRWNDKKINEKKMDISFLKVEKELTSIIEEDKNSGKKIVAIGECGLDYHNYNNNPTVETHHDASLQEKNVVMQKNLLQLHFKLSQKYNLPLIIHCRDAYTDLLNFQQTTNNKQLQGVIHCFQGSLSDLKQFLELGFYIGYDGYITYGDKSQNPNPKSQNDPVIPAKAGILSSKIPDRASLVRNDKKEKILVNPNTQKEIAMTRYEEIVYNTPLNRILTETDSPWLTPEPHRGTRNTPTNIEIITEKIAEIKKMSFEEIDKITTENAEKLFKF